MALLIYLFFLWITHECPTDWKIHAPMFSEGNRLEAINHTSGMMGYRDPRTDPLRRAFYGCTWSEELGQRRRTIRRSTVKHRLAWIPEWNREDNYLDNDECEV